MLIFYTRKDRKEICRSAKAIYILSSWWKGSHWCDVEVYFKAQAPRNMMHLTKDFNSGKAGEAHGYKNVTLQCFEVKSLVVLFLLDLHRLSRCFIEWCLTPTWWRRGSLIGRAELRWSQEPLFFVAWLPLDSVRPGTEYAFLFFGVQYVRQWN